MLEADRGARGRVDLGRVVRLVDPGTEVLLADKQGGRPFDDALKQVDPQREVCRDHDPDSGVVDHLPQRVLPVVPPRGSDHHVDARLGQTWHVHHGRVRR